MCVTVNDQLLLFRIEFAKGNGTQKIMIQPIKRLSQLSGMLLFCLLAGCLPFPHTTERSPEVRGRVLDAITHTPVQGAKIFLSDHPDVACWSDSAGHFRLRATSNFHWGLTVPEGDWPRRKYWGSAVAISCVGYEDYTQNGPDDWRLTDKGDILLKPKH
jgi:hypothetical protein